MRAAAVREAEYLEIKVEPRLNPNQNRRRGDISYIDRSDIPVVYHLTDDCVGHPLSPSYLAGELSGKPKSKVLNKKKKEKTKKYSEHLATMRAHPTVIHGQRVICFRVCAFTSLGEYGVDTVKFINATAARIKKLASEEARNGLSPATVSARFRLSIRAKLQAAIMKGNGIIASGVGL